MREVKKQQKRWLVRAMCAVLAAGSVLCGCSGQGMTKTIQLPDTENEEKGIPGIIINRIQEYVYDGHSEDNLWLGWGETGSDMVCMLRYGEKGYTYRKIDVNTKETISKVFVDDRMIFNIKIAPGGRYISYEAEVAEGAGSELILFAAEEEKHIVLREWDECLQGSSYVWSDDGTKLFSWQNGDDPAFLPDNNWYVACYDMDTLKQDDKGELSVEKKEFLMKGNGYAWRSVLPNADGSEVYVREEYESFSDSKSGEYTNESAKIKMKQENMAVSENAEEQADGMKETQSWILRPGSQEKTNVAEYAKSPIYPVKYTKKGLYYRSDEGKLCLAEHVEDKPSVTELFSVSNIETCICGNGDHIFFIEWTDDMRTLQISGVRMEGTEPTAKQVLYKASCESADYLVTADDSAIVLQTDAYLGDDRNSFRITELGY